MGRVAATNEIYALLLELAGSDGEGFKAELDAMLASAQLTPESLTKENLQMLVVWYLNSLNQEIQPEPIEGALFVLEADTEAEPS